MENMKEMESISNKKVVEMFETLLTSMNVMKTELHQEMQELKDEKKEKVQLVQNLQSTQDNQQVEIDKLKEESTQNSLQIDQLVDTITRQDQVIQELKYKVDALERDRLRPNLIIQGIEEDQEEDCIMKAKSFFKNTMKLKQDISIRKAHQLGKGKGRLMKIVLTNVNDKSIIYSNVRNLQGKKNKFNKNYHIEDKIPARNREERKKFRDTCWRNKSLSVAERLLFSLKKGKLIINDKDYKYNIQQPDIQKLLKLKTDRVKEIRRLNVVAGAEIKEGSSTFTGYVCDVDNFTEVNQALEYVKFHNMDARHIVSACKISNTEYTLGTEYHDDDEHGSGKLLLDYLYEVELDNRAVFVARKYDGKHIGKARHEYLICAAKSAVNQKPFNRKTQQYQFSWSNTRGQGGGHSGGGKSKMCTASEAESTLSEDSSQSDSKVVIQAKQCLQVENSTSWNNTVEQAEAWQEQMDQRVCRNNNAATSEIVSSKITPTSVS